MKKVDITKISVDSILDKIGETKVDKFYEFYKILQKNSIENGNIIEK
jgi:hypothetical protein